MNRQQFLKLCNDVQDRVEKNNPKKHKKLRLSIEDFKSPRTIDFEMLSEKKELSPTKNRYF
jgi:hypothetical protein